MRKRSIIITGAAHGVGAACARRFAQEGEQLTLVDIDESAGQAITKEIESTHKEVAFVHADISSRLHVHNIMAEALESNERVDVLINASPVYHATPFLEISEEDFEKAVHSNLIGSFLINQTVAKQFLRQISKDETENPGAVSTVSPVNYSILNFSAINNYHTDPELMAFECAQAGLMQMSKGVAQALGAHTINVNTINIGPMRGEGNPKEDPSLTLERSVAPSDAANVAWFLASEEAAFVSGQTINVDGAQFTSISKPIKDDD